MKIPCYLHKRTMPNLNYQRLESTLPESVAQRIETSVCAPISAANPVVYLAAHNKSSLIPPNCFINHTFSPTKLIDQLILDMKTEKKGTLPINFIYGLKKFLIDRNYSPSIQWAGINYTGKHKVLDFITPEWIMSNSIGSKNCILWVGLYEFDKRTNTFNRKTGHAVTVAGYKSSMNFLIINDCTAFKPFTKHYFHKLEEGKIARNDLPAKKFYVLSEYERFSLGLTSVFGKKIPILEAAISFNVE